MQLLLAIGITVGGLGLIEAASPKLTFKKVTSDRGRFTVEMPGTPKQETSEVRDWKRNTFAVLVVEKGSVYRFFVSYMDLTDVDVHDPQKVMKAYQSGAGRGQTIVEDREIRFGPRKLPGRDYMVDAGKGVSVRERFVIDGIRFYEMFIATTASKDFLTSKDADRFFDSFQVGK